MKIMFHKFRNKLFSVSALVVCCVVLTGTACQSQIKPQPLLVPPTYAFITNSYNNFITACEVNGGNLDSCTSNIVPGLSTPYGIAISNGYAFIANHGNSSTSSVTSCAVSGAVLTSCTTMTNAQLNNTLNGPWGITISDGFAYITNSISSGGGYNITSCVVSNGNLTSCTNTTSSSAFVRALAGIAISNGYVYITESNAYATSCIVSNGTLTGCANPTNINALTGGDYNNGAGIAINNGYAVLLSAAGAITCQVSGGIFSNCSTNNFLSNLSLAGVAISNGYAFITNYFNSQLSELISCQLNGGNLSACKYVTSTIAPYSYGIAIN